MLLLGSKQWRLFPLSVQLLSSANAGLLVGLPQPPPHIPVTIAAIEVGAAYLVAANLAIRIHPCCCGTFQSASTAAWWM